MLSGKETVKEEGMSEQLSLLQVEENGNLRFGDYTLSEKKKLDQFEYRGDVYKVKTYAGITKLEKNGMFVYESVPGSAVSGFAEEEDGVRFSVTAAADVQFTLELSPETEYEVIVNGSSTGCMKTNLSGKLSVSVELSADEKADVQVRKCR